MPNDIHMIVIVGAGFPRPHKLVNYVGREDRAPTLGQIIAYFKYTTTKRINIVRDNVGVKIWQRNYYEHIIRNEKEYFEIRRYIEDNPVNWLNDEMYS